MTGLADYWVVNLVADTVEVHRQPGRLPSGRVGYRQVRVLRRGATISPLGAPGARIPVGALLP